MSNHQLLNNITHKDLHIICEHHPKYGDTASYTGIMLSEIDLVQGDYPIFFRKNTNTGQFECIALFGLSADENLYLDDNGWHASYIPLTIRRRPFLIGFSEQEIDGEIKQEAMIHVDMDSPRISTTMGEPVFLPQGGQTEFLQQAATILNEINNGHEQTKRFIEVLLEHDLIESVNVNITLKDENSIALNSLYTINSENLAKLDGSVLSSLHQQGYIKAMHMILASTANLNDLIAKKNASL
ncbi:SapC family protein [Thalassomonas sp. M1454]|uniref:SapC family protein n=1 Tax=Thalassomonas sp. M1454 TaxID=2594477 RepID=UPI00117EAC9E|nr:SapC family protein [Thalassomonas sp. M1454]TRX52843.1 SapC family protein [Thalassomonas sp. M1454]